MCYDHKFEDIPEDVWRGWRDMYPLPDPFCAPAIGVHSEYCECFDVHKEILIDRQ